MELIEENLLLAVWPTDAARAEGAPVSGLQEDVAARDPAQILQGVLGMRAAPMPSTYVRQIVQQHLILGAEQVAVAYG